MVHSFGAVRCRSGEFYGSVGFSGNRKGNANRGDHGLNTCSRVVFIIQVYVYMYYVYEVWLLNNVTFTLKTFY